MTPRVEIDDPRRRVTLTSGFNIPSRMLIGVVIDLVAEAPRRADHDFILDVRESYGDGSHEHVLRAAEAFLACGGGRRAAHTCFITLDTGFVHWARAMDFCFVNRTHQVFPNPETAHAFLDRLQAADAA